MSTIPIVFEGFSPPVLDQLQAMLRGLPGSPTVPALFATWALADAARASGAFTAPQVISVTADETMDGGPSLYFYDGTSLGNPLIR